MMFEARVDGAEALGPKKTALPLTVETVKHLLGFGNRGAQEA